MSLPSANYTNSNFSFSQKKQRNGQKHWHAVHTLICCNAGLEAILTPGELSDGKKKRMIYSQEHEAFKTTLGALENIYWLGQTCIYILWKPNGLVLGVLNKQVNFNTCCTSKQMVLQARKYDMCMLALSRSCLKQQTLCCCTMHFSCIRRHRQGIFSTSLIWITRTREKQVQVALFFRCQHWTEQKKCCCQTFNCYFHLTRSS